MKKMTTMFFAMAIAVVFAQDVPTPAPAPVINQTPQPVSGSATTSAPFFCPPFMDKVWLVDNTNFQELCFAEGAQAFSRTLFQETGGGYQQIAVIDPTSFYAYRTDGKILRYDGGSGARNIFHWRTYGGGVIVGSDPTNSSVDIRLPFDGEMYRFYLYPGVNPVPQQLFTGAMDQARMFCGQTVQTVTKKELCVNVGGSFVWQPRPTIAGPDYSPGQLSTLFDKQSPVNLAVLSETFYVTLGTQYVYPDNPSPGPVPPSAIIPGKLVSVVENFDGTDNIVTLLDNIDIGTDAMSQRMAVSNRGVYFVEQAHRGTDLVNRLSFYSFATKKVTPLYDSVNYISAIAVGQNAASLTMANPPVPLPYP